MATTPHPAHRRWLLLAAAAIAALLPLTLSAQLDGRYNSARPLVIACDWEFPPYEFSNNEGQPDGINVQVMSAILTEMKIPHRFVMKEWYQAAADFERHRADLIFDPVFRYRSQPYYASRSVMSYYNIKVASRKDTPPIDSVSQLDKTSRLVLKKNDITTLDILHGVAPALSADARSAAEALMGIADSTYDYFVWGEEPLKWSLKEMNLQGIVIGALDVPAGEIHFVGYDKELIDEIDDRYARMEQDGQIEQIYSKWFHHDTEQDNASPFAIYATLAFLLIVLALLLSNRLAKRRAKSATRKSMELENILRQAVNMSQSAVILYDPQSKLFINRYGDMLPEEGITREQFSEHIHPMEVATINKAIDRLFSGKTTPSAISIRWKPFPCDHLAVETQRTEWQHLSGHAFAEVDDNGMTSLVVFSVRYVTAETLEEQDNRETSSRYTRMFDTSLVAMSFYDTDGYLVDLNQKMRDLCGFDKEGEKFFRQTRLFDAVYFRDDLPRDLTGQFYVCQHIHYPELGIDKFIELRIRPLYDDDGQLTYYTVTARDVGVERAIELELQRHEKEMMHTNERINAYELQLQYLLEHSSMFVWEFDLATQSITFSRSLSKVEFTHSREDYIGWMVESEREQANNNLMEKMKNGLDFNAVHHFTHTPFNSQPCWYALSGMPALTPDKRLKGYFGIARDITPLMEAQEQLRRETKRADESGMLKSVFLANMTHEIRTPLNAIVGFSDLLQVIDDANDRREFIRIIRNNCDMLLRLINDIIEASNMNQGPIAIEENDVDFAVAFSDICQTLAQRVEEPGVQFIVDNPYATFPTRLDKGRMQQVITNFTTNAVKYTRKGHIKVGYRYTDEQQLAHDTGAAPAAQPGRMGIYMYCEDTGTGIPKDKQASVFERFVKLNDYVQGTGLGLSICQSIADRCEGHIGVSSEGEGHGCTFWIWIPCPLKGEAKPS